MLRRLMMIVMLLGITEGVQAGESARELAGKPAAKLLGTWHSVQGKNIIFKSNGIIVYQGHRHRFAAANGMLQIKSRHAMRNIPYKIFDGKLTITENGVDTVYTRK